MNRPLKIHNTAISPTGLARLAAEIGANMKEIHSVYRELSDFHTPVGAKKEVRGTIGSALLYKNDTGFGHVEYSTRGT
jgi:hypothetical protein